MSTEKSNRKNTTFHIVYKKVCLAITFTFILCENALPYDKTEKIKLFLSIEKSSLLRSMSKKIIMSLILIDRR